MDGWICMDGWRGSCLGKPHDGIQCPLLLLEVSVKIRTVNDFNQATSVIMRSCWVLIHTCMYMLLARDTHHQEAVLSYYGSLPPQLE